MHILTGIRITWRELKARGLGATGVLPLLGAVYAIAICTVNAGFMISAGLWLYVFFSVSDYFKFSLIFLAGLYAGIAGLSNMVSFITSIAKDIEKRRATKVVAVGRAHPRRPVLDYVAKKLSKIDYFITAYFVCFAIIVTMSAKGLLYELKMEVSLSLLLLLGAWTLCMTFELVGRNGTVRPSFLFLDFPVLFMLSCVMIGMMWADVAKHSKFTRISIMYDDGKCLQFNLVRSAGAGLVVYSPYADQVEFRRVDRVTTIYPGHGCL